MTGAMFGIYAMISLTCEQRRKEIAGRKINGADTRAIIGLFLKKQLWLLAGAAAVAFPVGTVLMLPWIEQFILQAPVTFWIYPLLLAVAALLAAIIVLRIWKSVHRNPVQELRKE